MVRRSRLLSEFEERIERIVDRAFGKLLKSSTHPVEILRKAARAQDLGKVVYPGYVVAPNMFRVCLSAADYARLDPVRSRLQEEIELALTRQAAREGWALLGPVSVEFQPLDALSDGVVEVEVAMSESRPGAKGLLIAPDGQRIELEDEMLFGRSPECDVVLQDTWCSRRHAKIVRGEEGYEITDLQSTNGTFVNEEKVERKLLRSGDALRLGRTTFRFVVI
jgi:hypothetical protein